MSASEKFFERPKVRFSKSAETPEKLTANRVFAKPKIRSITSLEPQVKILKAPIKNDEFQRGSSPEEIISRHSAGDSPNDVRLCPKRSTSLSTPCLSEVILSPESRSSHVKFALDEEKNSRNLSKTNSAPKPSKSILTEKKSMNETEKLSLEPDTLKSWKNIVTEKKSLKKNSSSSVEGPKKSIHSLCDENLGMAKEKVSKTSSRVQDAEAGKENFPSRRCKQTVNTHVPGGSMRMTRTKIKNADSQNDVEKPTEKKNQLNSEKSVLDIKHSQQKDKITKVSSEMGVTRKINEKTNEAPAETNKKVKPKPIGLMPCMKSKRAERKNVPMKKTILRDTTAVPTNVYIGPGFPRSRSLQPVSQEKLEKRSKSHLDVCSGDRLARPEYNSIVCTLKKLREVSEEKVIGSIEHLPAIYRRLIKGKISSALDFGANEEIFHGLIDLSVDEKQFPSRLTRSKDPEPRERDVTPKLSDFFVPTNDEEYGRAVLVRPPSPRIYDTWNPYKITERMLSWKESLDHEF